MQMYGLRLTHDMNEYCLCINSAPLGSTALAKAIDVHNFHVQAKSGF